MKTNNKIILALSAVAAVFLLFLWHHLGFDHIDSPFDLIIAAVWLVAIVLIGYAVYTLEKKRKRQIRTVYVGSGALFNSEAGLVYGPTDASAIKEVLAGLKYGFGGYEVPKDGSFTCEYVVESDEFEKDDDSKWAGKVTKIDRANGNTEVDFKDMAQLADALDN